jgi:N-methylhydantoinase A
MGLLKVGPDSAGADPGPACYAQGGKVPTVTDADLLLGYLDPGFFLGGRMRLDVNAARQAVEETVGRTMSLSLTDAAWGIHRVVNENMAAAARVHGIERGKDLRAYPLFAFGGAGPVHAWHVGRILKVPRVLVPFGAGAMSAYGLLAAPLAFDFVRTASQRLDAADWAQINRLYEEMEAEGRAVLRAAAVADGDVRIRRTAEMHYTGQGHEVEVELPAGHLSEASLGVIVERYEGAYRALYSRVPLGVPIEALNFRVVVSGPVPDISVWGSRPDAVPAAATTPAPKGRRPAYFPEAGGYVDTPVYDRYALSPGAAFAGPAIVEERESTTVAGPGARVRVDGRLTLVLEPGEAT